MIVEMTRRQGGDDFANSWNMTIMMQGIIANEPWSSYDNDFVLKMLDDEAQ